MAPASLSNPTPAHSVAASTWAGSGSRTSCAVDFGDGSSLTMLKFPGEEIVTLELVHRPADEPGDVGTGFSHLVVQVEVWSPRLVADWT